MFGKKKIKELEARIDSLEKRIASLEGLTTRVQTTEKKDELEYKDILDQWLNGEEKK